jgi:threonine dehydrogenase-like Zn-dependent dehydrogenase
MKAVCWQGKKNVQVRDVPDPHVINPRDAVVRITSTAICGSDLHLYDGYIPTMQAGDILGHEFMGEVVDLGSEVKNLKTGDRVVVPFTIACGRCVYCKRGLWSLCDNSNPNAELANKLYGYSGSGLFGYSHLYGGYAGGQAEYARVPFADVGCFKIPDDLTDEQVLFLSDILPTGYMAAENCHIQPGDTVAVWGCGPVGQFAIQSAWWFGAERVIAIDHRPGRLQLAADMGRAETINFDEVNVPDALDRLTYGQGPDACIDCVGLEAHGATIDAVYDRVKAAMFLATDRLHALRQAIYCCRKGGAVSIPGVYGGFLDKVPMGAAFAKGLKMAMGQTHVHSYMWPLYERIRGGKNGNGHAPTAGQGVQKKQEVAGFDPSYIVTHRFPLEEAAHAYDLFSTDQDECIKVVLKPHS